MKLINVVARFFHVPFVCILFSVYPLYHLWSLNWEEVFIKELIILTAFVFIVAFVFYKFASLIFRNKSKSTIATLIFLIMFVSFEWFFDFEGLIFQKFFVVSFFGQRVGRYAVLFPLWALIFVLLMIFLYITKKRLNRFIKVCTLIIVALILFDLPRVATNFYSIGFSLKSSEFKNEKLNITVSDKDLKVGYKPDIYYIILDGHPRADIVKDYFNYKTNFIDLLKQKDFFVAEKSVSNYPSTFLSLPSSINMECVPIESTRRYDGLFCSPIYSPYEYLCSSDLISFLKKQGYLFVNISSQYCFTYANKRADVELNNPWWAMSSFADSFFNKIFFGPILNYIHFFWDFAWDDKKCIFDQLDFLRETRRFINSKEEKPIFVFCHIICPHFPDSFRDDINFDELKDIDGAFMPIGNNEAVKFFVNEMINIDRRILVTIDSILKHSKKDPVIVLQSDHGSYCTDFGLWTSLNDKEKAPKILLRERMSILNAYHLPGERNENLYPDITPVNSFRLILDYYFNTNIGLLNDKCFWAVHGYPFDFKEMIPAEINDIDIKKEIEKIKNEQAGRKGS